MWKIGPRRNLKTQESKITASEWQWFRLLTAQLRNAIQRLHFNAKCFQGAQEGKRTAEKNATRLFATRRCFECLFLCFEVRGIVLHCSSRPFPVITMFFSCPSCHNVAIFSSFAGCEFSKDSVHAAVGIMPPWNYDGLFSSLCFSKRKRDAHRKCKLKTVHTHSRRMSPTGRRRMILRFWRV